MSKTKILYLSIALVLAASFFALGYFWEAGKEFFQKGAKEPQATSLDEMAAGEVGEVLVGEEETGLTAPLVTATMPLAIFSTTGEVTEVKSDRIILLGEGTNFADGVSRTITAIFTSETITFNKTQTFRWHGLAGLKQLQPGTEVLIEGVGNIRGKTEFEVKTINIL